MPYRGRLQLRRIGAGIGLGHPERLQPQGAAGDLRQVAPLLLVGAVAQQGAHDIHLCVAGCGVASGTVDFLQDQAALEDAQTAAAVSFRNQRCKVPGLAQFLHECLGIFAFFVQLAPVCPRIELTQIGDRLLQRQLFFGEGDVDVRHGAPVFFKPLGK